MTLVEIVGFGLAAIAFVLLAGIWVRASRQTQRASEVARHLEEQLARAEEHGKEVEARAEEVSARASVLEQELTEALARRDEKAVAEAMWGLELERSYRQWRDVIAPSGVSEDRGINEGQQLAFAISQEVDRLREEVGVAIRFDGGLDAELEPDVALAALRVSEELLAMAAKRADEVDVSLDQTDEAIEVVLGCRGWEEGHDPVVSELAESVARMSERLDGSVEWRRETVADLTIVVEFPVASGEDEEDEAEEEEEDVEVDAEPDVLVSAGDDTSG